MEQSKTLEELQKQVHSYYYLYSTGSTSPQLRKTALATLKDLNAWLANSGSLLSSLQKKNVLSLCSSLLKLYDSLKDIDTNAKLISHGEKICWLSSKIDSISYLYPYDPKIGIFLENTNDLSEGNNLDCTGLSSLYQQLGSDCSFVASMLSISNCNDSLFKDIIFIKDNYPNAAIKLHIGGSRRCMIISNNLPSDKNKTVRSSTNPDLVWPAILEKAYLQIYGYTSEDSHLFTGSNFASDTYLLTGWIPEYIKVSKVSKEYIELIYEAFTMKRVILGLGTGDLPQIESQRAKIVPKHDYSIVDIERSFASPTGFVFTLKNPWLSQGDRIIRTEVLDSFFETMYVNWKPDMFKFKTSKLFLSSNPINNSFNSLALYNRQQFALYNDSECTDIWILIEKSIGSTQFIDMYVYLTDSPSQKVYTKSLLKSQCECLDNTTRFQLCKLKIPSKASMTCALVERSGDILDHSRSKKISQYSISCFSDEKIEMLKVVPTYPFEFRLSGKWDITLPCGNFNYPSYINNPQFEICIADDKSTEKEISIKIGVLTSSKVQCNLLLFVHQSNRFQFLTSFAANSLVFNQSTEYSYGGVFYNDLTLYTNQRYIAVVSAYDKFVNETFEIYLNSPIKSSVFKPIDTNLGLYHKQLEFNWCASRVKDIKFRLQRRANLTVRVGEEKPEVRRIKVSIQDDMSTEITSSDWNDSVFDVFIGGKTFQINGGVYTLRIEREEQTDLECSILFGSSTNIELLDI